MAKIICLTHREIIYHGKIRSDAGVSRDDTNKCEYAIISNDNIIDNITVYNL